MIRAVYDCHAGIIGDGGGLMKNAPLETLLLPFREEMIAVPERSLFMRAETHPMLRSWKGLVGWQPLKSAADDWSRHGLALTELDAGTYPAVLLLPGKGKEETLYHFALACDQLESGGLLIASMPNTSGAKRFEKRLKDVAQDVESISKNKCRVFWAVKGEGWDTAMVDEWRALGDAKPIEGADDIHTCPGVFSAGKVDEGSAMLVDQFPQEFTGMVADFGAGWGYLSREVLQRNGGIRRLDIFEADSRALALAERNIVSKSKAPHFHWHDIEAGVSGSYDWIVMNPPFHQGSNTDIGLGKVFIEVAAQALSPGGRLLMVANRQLPYEAELTRLGLKWKLVEQDNRFKILIAEKEIEKSE